MALASTCNKMWRCFREMQEPGYGLKTPITLHLVGERGYCVCCELLSCEGVFSRLVNIHFDNVRGIDRTPIDISILPDLKGIEYTGEVYVPGFEEACSRESVSRVIVNEFSNIDHTYEFAGEWACDTLVLCDPIPYSLERFGNVKYIYLCNKRRVEYDSIDVGPLKGCEFVYFRNLDITGLESLSEVQTVNLESCVVESFPEYTRMNTRRLFVRNCDFFVSRINAGSPDNVVHSGPNLMWFPEAESIVIEKQAGVVGVSCLSKMLDLRRLKLDSIKEITKTQIEEFFSIPFLDQFYIGGMNTILRIPRVRGEIKKLQLSRLGALEDISELLETSLIEEVQIGGSVLVPQAQIDLLVLKQSSKEDWK
jgi:hypothetical protein